ncbi:hypothetical protein Hanom_Chr13g01204631 [Helianthus anomalus]
MFSCFPSCINRTEPTVASFLALHHHRLRHHYATVLPPQPLNQIGNMKIPASEMLMMMYRIRYLQLTVQIC